MAGGSRGNGFRGSACRSRWQSSAERGASAPWPPTRSARAPPLPPPAPAHPPVGPHSTASESTAPTRLDPPHCFCSSTCSIPAHRPTAPANRRKPAPWIWFPDTSKRSKRPQPPSVSIASASAAAPTHVIALSARSRHVSVGQRASAEARAPAALSSRRLRARNSADSCVQEAASADNRAAQLKERESSSEPEPSASETLRLESSTSPWLFESDSRSRGSGRGMGVMVRRVWAPARLREASRVTAQPRPSASASEPGAASGPLNLIERSAAAEKSREVRCGQRRRVGPRIAQLEAESNALWMPKRRMRGQQRRKRASA
eukprot:3467063-Rhodomonas_salina.2